MRPFRELPLAAPLVLAGLALFFGGGPGDGSIPWLGIGALAAVLALFASRGLPAGGLALLPLAGLVAWLALSISWSAMPDRSWTYANRGLVYLLFCLLGLWLAPRTRLLAGGLAALLGAVVAWSLLGKIVPPLYDDYGRVARLRGPVGLWNQLALLADFALPLALWRRRLAGTLLAYGWLVALLLTYSRGGLLTAVLVVAAWFAFGDERAESAATLVAAAVPAALVVAVAFALPGVASNGQSSHVRWHDGLIFGAVLIVGALGAAALERAPRPRVSRSALRAAAAAAVVAVVVAGAVGAGSAWRSFTSSASVGSSSGRFTSTGSNFRLTWWKQAWHGFEHHVAAGTGAGSFHVTNLRYRKSYLDVTTEPHQLPLQLLSETGLVGLVLFVLAALALLRRGRARPGHELALSLLLPAYLVHSLVDVDWDFVAVSVPAFLAAGALAGRAAAERRAPAFALVSLAGAALLAAVVLLLPWLGDRWSGQAFDALGGPSAHVETLAKRARSVDPLLVEPLWWQADAQSDPRVALALYAQATREQPQNAQAWLYKARFELDNGCPRLALADLYKFVALDPYAQPSQGPADYRRALRLVDTGKPTC